MLPDLLRRQVNCTPLVYTILSCIGHLLFRSLHRLMNVIYCKLTYLILIVANERDEIVTKS